MFDKDIYCGRGSHIGYEDYMRLINLAFNFNTPEQEFLPLLPKLYRPEQRPQDSNYVVTENGILAAAVGAYDHGLTVCGDTLPCRGIGNVAVHPDFRSRGYMKMAMEAALDDMVRDGIALSSLGGRRQRYQYFSYDKAGPCHTFIFNTDNLRHVWGDMTAPFDTVRAVTDSADPVLDEIKALSDSGAIAPVRSRALFLDISQSWHCDLLAVTHEGVLRGYAIMNGDGYISEIRAARTEDFLSVLRSVLVHTGRQGLTVQLPACETAYITALAPVCEGVSTACSMMYSVLNYRRVVTAFMKLKATYTDLPDGAISLLIHGRGGEERLLISVADGKPSVEIADEGCPPHLELSHMEAMNLLFAPVSPLRDTLPAIYRLWFPLPLWIYKADEV